MPKTRNVPLLQALLQYTKGCRQGCFRRRQRLPRRLPFRPASNHRSPSRRTRFQVSLFWGLSDGGIDELKILVFVVIEGRMSGFGTTITTRSCRFTKKEAIQ